MDRALKSSGSRNYILLLADSGMGKTTFCINYRSHLQKISPDQNCAVISLSSVNCEQLIAQIPNKSDCILLLDALDEDPKAMSGGRERLDKILDISADFQSVIVTCRSQFFTDDNTIPVELRIARVGPRPLGQNQNITLKRFYLAPFDEDQIRRYINRNFPRWNVARWQQRKRAFKLVSDIPELSARPMLLERLPELARGDEGLTELYELYEFMVQGWAGRESKWIEPNKLLSVSQNIAISMYRMEGNQYYRVSSSEIKSIANTLINNDPDWNHLTTRSLLNRDSSGHFKFAHKSIMEFFVVRAAIAGDPNAFSAPWTPFMKELFISWGYSSAGIQSLDIAKQLLTGTESRRAIMPLSDYWAVSANNSFPNFRYSASRRVSGLGSKRLAVPQWRGSNISFTQHADFTEIDDHEFFLKWRVVHISGNPGEQQQTNLVNIQKISESAPDQRLPTYDEFISLVEGVDVSKRNDLLPDGKFFAISDSPGSRRHLLVSLGKNIDKPSLTKIIDKERLVSVTNRTINCYETGIKITPKYANRISVQQLWVVER